MRTILPILAAIFSFTAGDDLLEPVRLELGTALNFAPEVAGSTVFCYTGRGNTTSPLYLFREAILHVNELEGKPIPWYTVRGMSTDDVYAHWENFFYSMIETLGVKNARRIQAPHKIESYLRDTVTACPNPLFAPVRSECSMKFSTIGRSCVKITTSGNTTEPYHFAVFVEEKTNPRFLLRFALGIGAFFVAGNLGHNLVFQYASGAVIFICGGVLSGLLLALKFLARKRGVHMSVPRKLIIAVLLTVAYTTVVLWYLRQHWHNLILDHPRLLLGYVFLTGTLGVVAVQMLRQNHDDQVRLTLAVKWIFRAVGAALLYNSTASPLGSMSVMSLGILLYMTYVLYKPKHLIPHIAGTARSQTVKATTQVDEQESTVIDKKSAPSARARKGKSRLSGTRDRGTASPARADGRKSP